MTNPWTPGARARLRGLLRLLGGGRDRAGWEAQAREVWLLSRFGCRLVGPARVEGRWN